MTPRIEKSKAKQNKILNMCHQNSCYATLVRVYGSIVTVKVNVKSWEISKIRTAAWSSYVISGSVPKEP